MNVDFKFDIYEKVRTPLTDTGIVTMLGFKDGIIKYFIENSDQGVTNTWWAEDRVSKL